MRGPAGAVFWSLSNQLVNSVSYGIAETPMVRRASIATVAIGYNTQSRCSVAISTLTVGHEPHARPQARVLRN